MSKWAVLAICAAGAGAVAILGIWAFVVRGGGETIVVTIPESGNPAEYRWASGICAAVARWDRSWVDEVIEPTAPANASRVDIGDTIETMRELIQRLGRGIDAVEPPTERAKQAQDYLRITPKAYARELAEMEPDFPLEDFAFVRARSRVAALNFLARKIRVETTWLIRYPYYASPYVGVALADSEACRDVPRLRRLEEWD